MKLLPFKFLVPAFALLGLGAPARAQTSQADTSAIRAALTADEYQQFRAWTALGVGGLPHTLEGFRTLQRLNQQLRNPLDLTQLAARMGQTGDLSTLKNLPKRVGTRPAIAPFAIPHRQLDQHNATAIREKQQAVFGEVVARNRALVHFRKSYFERHNEAVFLNDSARGNPTVVPTTHAEVGHLHPTDGSMHFSLSPSDTREVIEKGWGELHGLAGQVYKPASQLPATYLMVYAPRSEAELAVTKRILEAAILYSSLRTDDPAARRKVR
jgi:hypothetical protein